MIIRSNVRLFRIICASRELLQLALDRYARLDDLNNPAIRATDNEGNAYWAPVTSAEERQIIRVLVPLIQTREHYELDPRDLRILSEQARGVGPGRDYREPWEVFLMNSQPMYGATPTTMTLRRPTKL